MMTAIYSLAYLANLRHTIYVAQTNATGFSSLNVPRRTNRPMAVFFRPYTTRMRTFFGRALVGRARALPVPLDAGLLTPPRARPPHLAVGSGLNKSKEAVMYANALARPEQTPSPAQLPFFDAGLQAAYAWFAQGNISAAAHRDDARCALVRSIPDDSEAALASTVFNRGFARGLALVIAGGAA